ncbi:MAG: SDR family NAD(P)-dependent oxidoreductase [Verrucomicrobiales bacterium]|nr:SDR family NAD(P)-dependent oxidoreductase [Verrucomicrobiales bacterium]
MDELRFQDQVAIVTGGGDGIGKSVATRLAEEGANVTLFDISVDRAESVAGELAESGLRCEVEIVDVSDEESVRAGIEAVAGRNEGKLDIVVHCAGIVGPNATRITEVSVEDFDRTQAVNLRGTFLMTKYSLQVMEKQDYGRILNFASIAGKEGNAGMSPYSSSKAGVIGLVKSAGKEFAETGITVNAIAPAVIRTPMVEGVHPDQVKYMTDKIPMKRCGTLEEIASLSCWIVSPEASFCTAFTFDLSGGRAVY